MRLPHNAGSTIKPADLLVFVSNKCKNPCEESHDKRIEFDDWKSPGPASLKFPFQNSSLHLKDTLPSPVYLSIESRAGCHVGVQVQTLEGIQRREQNLARQQLEQLKQKAIDDAGQSQAPDS
jgi:hypothetical protein